MASPNDYRFAAGGRVSTANGVVTMVLADDRAVAPIREGSPEEDDAPIPYGMLSRSEQITIPGFYTQAIATNTDPMLLRDGQGLKLYDQLLSDDTVFSTLQQRRLAITSRDWEVTPGDDADSRSVRAADDFRDMLKGIGFDRVTGLLHYAVFYGYGVGEGIYTTQVRDGRSVVWLDDIVVPDRRHFAFTEDGELRFIGNLSASVSGDVVPPNKFVTIRTGGTHDFAFYGLGLAHWCYWSVYFKRAGMQSWAYDLDKAGKPTVGIEYGTGQENDTKAKGDLLRAAMDITQATAVALPPGYIADEKVRIFERTRSSAGSSGFKDFVGEQNEAIMRVILGQPGTSKGVSSGLNSDQASQHADVKAEIVKADSDLISEALNRTFAKWLTAWNYGPDVAPPVVYRVLDDTEDQNTVADRDVKLDGIGIKRTEESIRAVYGDGYEIAEPVVPPELVAPAPVVAEPVQFSAADEAAIDGLIAAAAAQGSKHIAKLADAFAAELDGITDPEAGRVAIMNVIEQFSAEDWAREFALPLLAERAAAVVGREDEVTA